MAKTTKTTGGIADSGAPVAMAASLVLLLLPSLLPPPATRRAVLAAGVLATSAPRRGRAATAPPGFESTVFTPGASLCKSEARGRPARPRRLAGRGWPKIGAKT